MEELRAETDSDRHGPADSKRTADRRLWPDGGYYLDNGASLCEQHHLMAEATLIECERLREACGETISSYN